MLIFEARVFSSNNETMNAFTKFSNYILFGIPVDLTIIAALLSLIFFKKFFIFSSRLEFRKNIYHRI